MSVKPQFAFPVRYYMSECPGPDCMYGKAKFCVYEVTVFGNGKAKRKDKIVRLCAKCRKSYRINESGRIVKGATVVKQNRGVGYGSDTRYRAIRSRHRSVSNGS